MEENDLDLDLDKIEVQTDQKLKVKNRFQTILEKGKVMEQERDAASAKATKAEEEKAALAKERDFFKDFSTYSSKYPNANQYQTKIFDKVRAGYSTEDAIVSTLNSEGKLLPSHQVRDSKEVAGGSAQNQLTDKDKPLESMTRAEKLSELMDAEKRGDISMS